MLIKVILLNIKNMLSIIIYSLYLFKFNIKSILYILLSD